MEFQEMLMNLMWQILEVWIERQGAEEAKEGNDNSRRIRSN